MTIKRFILIIISPLLLALFLFGLLWYVVTRFNGITEFCFDAVEWFMKK